MRESHSKTADTVNKISAIVKRTRGIKDDGTAEQWTACQNYMKSKLVHNSLLSLCHKVGVIKPVLMNKHDVHWHFFDIFTGKRSLYE